MYGAGWCQSRSREGVVGFHHHNPDPDRLCTLREELDQLDDGIREEVPAGKRHYELNLLSQQANACLTAASPTGSTMTPRQRVESNWKSNAHTTFDASASIGGIDEAPARLCG